MSCPNVLPRILTLAWASASQFNHVALPGPPGSHRVEAWPRRDRPSQPAASEGSDLVEVRHRAGLQCLPLLAVRPVGSFVMLFCRGVKETASPLQVL